MTAGHDMPHDPAPLTAEERALAQRLAQLGAQGEPSPALDARILAAAHAAVASRTARSPRRLTRLPIAFGVAASLALAVGVAWRLRPLPEAPIQYESETASTAAAASTPGQAPSEAAAAADATPALAADSAASAREQATVIEPSTRAAIQAGRAESRPVPAGVAAPEAFPPAPAPPPAQPASPPAKAQIVFDQPSPMMPTAAPAPTRPIAEAAAAQAGAAADVATQRAKQSRAQYESKAAAAEPEIEMDIPPATADAPEVRDAWLQRIRELAGTGKLDDARASLREFVHRYPNHPLPEDLRALLP